jgi:hypothetical protein
MKRFAPFEEPAGRRLPACRSGVIDQIPRVVLALLHDGAPVGVGVAEALKAPEWPHSTLSSRSRTLMHSTRRTPKRTYGGDENSTPVYRCRLRTHQRSSTFRQPIGCHFAGKNHFQVIP